MPHPENRLYYGDNLDVLRLHVRSESVDLVYLDPPFNSNANYNVLFAEKDGTQAAGQMRAFEDTWCWDESAARVFKETVEQGGRVADVLLAFERFLGTNDMLAYLAMMAPRLVELRRALMPTGSLYLHCDSTASHYLKLLLDAVFGPENFRNDIIWKRRTGSSSSVHKANKFGATTDNLLFYVKGDKAALHTQYSFEAQGYQEYVDKFFHHDDGDGRLYRLDNLANPAPRPNLMYDYKGFKHPRNGWAISREKMEQWDKEGRLAFPKKPDGRIQRKRYLDELKGKPVQNLWDDIEAIGAQAAERLGYPTQKPVALLERIISASSDPGDVVLDPFCGCGTTIEAAQKLDRRWIGIDVTHLAIGLIKTRLRDAFGDAAKYEVIGEPTTVEDAAVLAESDKYQFQWWALWLVGARPIEQKKGADKGIDGRLYFHDGSKETRQIIISVKGGKLKSDDVHALAGVVRQEKADIGVLLSFDKPTQPMRTWAAGQGFYESPWGNHPRLQLLTVAEILAGKGIDYPRTAGTNVTYKQAPRALKKVAEPGPGLFEGESDG